MSYEAIRKSGLLERQGLMERYDFVSFAKYLTLWILIAIAADESSNSIACWSTWSTEQQKTLNSGINTIGFLVAVESIAI